MVRRNIQRQRSGNGLKIKGRPVVVCSRCGRVINALKPKKRTEGDIEYTYFQCRRCKEYYVISATDEALRRNIKLLEEMRQNAAGKGQTDKEHGEAQDLLRFNVKRSRELKEQHPFVFK